MLVRCLLLSLLVGVLCISMAYASDLADREKRPTPEWWESSKVVCKDATGVSHTLRLSFLTLWPSIYIDGDCTSPSPFLYLFIKNVNEGVFLLLNSCHRFNLH